MMKKIILVFVAIVLNTPLAFSEELSCRSLLSQVTDWGELQEVEEIVPDVSFLQEFPELSMENDPKSVDTNLVDQLLSFGNEATSEVNIDGFLDFVSENLGYHYLKGLILSDQLMGGGYNLDAGEWISLNFEVEAQKTDGALLLRYQSYAVYKLLDGLQHVLAYSSKGEGRKKRVIPVLLDTPNSESFDLVEYYDVEELSKAVGVVKSVVTSLYGTDGFSQVQSILDEISTVASSRNADIKLNDQKTGLRGMFSGSSTAKVVEANLVKSLFASLIEKFDQTWEEVEPSVDALEQKNALISLFNLVNDLRYGDKINNKEHITNIHILTNIWRPVLFEAVLAWRYGAINNFDVLAGHIFYMNSEDMPGEANCCWEGYQNPKDFRSSTVVKAHLGRLIEMIESNDSGVNSAELADVAYDEMRIPMLSTELDVNGGKFLNYTTYGMELGMAYSKLVDRYTFLSNTLGDKSASEIQEMNTLVDELRNGASLTKTEWSNKKNDLIKRVAHMLSSDVGGVLSVMKDLDEFHADVADLKSKVSEFQAQLEMYLSGELPGAPERRALDDKAYDFQRLYMMVMILKQNSSLIQGQFNLMKEGAQALQSASNAMTFETARESGALADFTRGLKGLLKIK